MATKGYSAVYIFGVGGIGSFLTGALAPRHKIFVSDFDIVEPKNAANQAYFKEDAGEKKIDVLNSVYGDRVVAIEDDKKMLDNLVTNTRNNTTWVIVATDSLETRLKLFQMIQKKYNEQRWTFGSTTFIDARCNGSMSNVYAFRGDLLSSHVDRIKKELKTLEEENQNDGGTSCSTRANEVDNTAGFRTAWIILKVMNEAGNRYMSRTKFYNFFGGSLKVAEL